MRSFLCGVFILFFFSLQLASIQCSSCSFHQSEHFVNANTCEQLLFDPQLELPELFTIQFVPSSSLTETRLQILVNASQVTDVTPYLTNGTLFGIDYSLVLPSTTTSSSSSSSSFSTTTTTSADSTSSSSVSSSSSSISTDETSIDSIGSSFTTTPSTNTTSPLTTTSTSSSDKIDDDNVVDPSSSGAADKILPTVLLPLALSAMSSNPSSKMVWASVGMVTLVHHACATTTTSSCPAVMNVIVIYPRHIRQICYNGTCQCTMAWSGEQCDIPNVCLLHSNGFSCDDGIDCTFNDQCNNGTCVGDRRVCDNVCGDGYVAGKEQCDDGNTNNNDACLNNCVVNVCGDGYLQTGVETCDDGNTVNGDGCSSTCQKENGWTCNGQPSSCVTRCGDGIIAGSEQCDQGNNNTVNGDGCSSTCRSENGWNCTGTPSSCVTKCGDGIIAGNEQCDQGNNNIANNDGCSSTCKQEAGWICTGSPSSCVTVCGDGIIAGSEQCDQGNTVNGDGCSSTCQRESGWNCTGTPSSCVTVCGDGIIIGIEQCDQGNNNTANGDGCSSTCQKENGWTCSGTPSSCVSTCGDGITVGNEQCDQGNTVNGDGCSSTCQQEPGWTCSGTPSSCVIASDFAGSTLLNGSMITQLLMWFPHGSTNWTACHKTSVNCTSVAFHKNCDNKGPTITIASANGYIFGGYNDLSWNGNNTYKYTTNSYLLSFTRPEGGNYKKIGSFGRGTRYVNNIYDGTNYGPTFGGGHDLVLANNGCSSLESYTNVGWSYGDGDSSIILGGSGKTYLCGTMYFQISSYEVFYLPSI